MDDETASATSYFLSVSVPPQHLHPVNWSPSAQKRIESITGVYCVPDSIENVVASFDALKVRSKEVLFACVWLDLTSRRVDASCLASSLNIAKVVKITISLRGEDKNTILRDFFRCVSAAGGVVHSFPCQYKGASDIANMIRFTVIKKREHICNKRPAEPVESPPQEKKKKTVSPSSPPESRLSIFNPYFLRERKEEASPCWSEKMCRDAFLSFFDSHGFTRFRSFDDLISWMASSLDSKGVENPIPISESVLQEYVTRLDLVGKRVHIPFDEWDSNPDSSEDILQSSSFHEDACGRLIRKPALVFMVTKTYYNWKKYVVHEVRRDGSVRPSPEKWVLTYFDAVRFSVATRRSPPN